MTIFRISDHCRRSTNPTGRVLQRTRPVCVRSYLKKMDQCSWQGMQRLKRGAYTEYVSIFSRCITPPWTLRRFLRRVLANSSKSGRHHPVDQASDGFDAAGDQIAGFQDHGGLAKNTDTGGGAGGDDVPGLEGDVLADVGDDRGDVVDQIPRISRLP